VYHPRFGLRVRRIPGTIEDRLNLDADTYTRAWAHVTVMPHGSLSIDPVGRYTAPYAASVTCGKDVHASHASLCAILAAFGPNRDTNDADQA